MKPIKVGVLGLGTVGAGVVELLARNGDDITRRADRDIHVTRAAVRDVHQPRACATDGIEIGTDPRAVVEDPAIDIVVELIGGDTLARELVLAAIDHGKHVVTANKHLLALHGNELFAAADRANVMIHYEAAVAGGIPIIKAIRESLAANRIDWLAGIINGTGNFILSRMKFEGLSFDKALSQAQTLGFAEADPSFDVDGIDAAHKLTILGSIAFGVPLAYDSIVMHGLRDIEADDIQYAEELGYRFKHLGIARRQPDGIALRVHPALVPNTELLANVEEEKNAVMVQGDALGPTVYYGAGAGSGPTASAVVADIIGTVRMMEAAPETRVPHLAFQSNRLSQETMLSANDFVCGHYLRIKTADKTGVMAEITRILAGMEIGIECILQKDPCSREEDAHIVIITKPVREGAVIQTLEDIHALPTTHGDIMHYRVANFES